jgi:hypothetical protein
LADTGGVSYDAYFDSTGPQVGLWAGTSGRTDDHARCLGFAARGLWVGGSPCVIDVGNGLGSLFVDGVDQLTKAIDNVVVPDAELLWVLLPNGIHEH